VSGRPARGRERESWPTVGVGDAALVRRAGEKCFELRDPRLGEPADLRVVRKHSADDVELAASRLVVEHRRVFDRAQAVDHHRALTLGADKLVPVVALRCCEHVARGRSDRFVARNQGLRRHGV
jgi:hypothetical protein